MEAFTLDTSGAVENPGWYHPAPDGPRYWRWDRLSPFAQGYVEALLRGPLGDGLRFVSADHTIYTPSFSDLAPETLAAILKDCDDVQEVAEFFADDPGASFWLNRQATWPAWATSRLHLMRRFPPLTPYLDDTGKVRLREAGQ